MLPIVILVVSCFGLCAFLIAIPYFFGPKIKTSPTKAADYECGVSAQQKNFSHIPVKFFLTAILFILFDIEIIFLYPFALAFRDFIQTDHGIPALLSMGVFIFIFIFGLWWEIKTKALDWK